LAKNFSFYIEYVSIKLWSSISLKKTIEIQMTRGLIKLALKSFKVYLILSLEYITG